MDDIQIIDLKSRTIFWEDLGMLSERKQSGSYKDLAARWWDDEVGPWLVEHVKGHVNPHTAGVWFADPDDAMLFKLTFAGTFACAV